MKQQSQTSQLLTSSEFVHKPDLAARARLRRKRAIARKQNLFDSLQNKPFGSEEEA